MSVDNSFTQRRKRLSGFIFMTLATFFAYFSGMGWSSQTKWINLGMCQIEQPATTTCAADSALECLGGQTVHFDLAGEVDSKVRLYEASGSRLLVPHALCTLALALFLQSENFLLVRALASFTRKSTLLDLLCKRVHSLHMVVLPDGMQCQHFCWGVRGKNQLLLLVSNIRP